MSFGFAGLIESVTAHEATFQGITGYWATCFDASYNYRLPAGAQAYTMDEHYHLYRVGTDGSIIPRNTAVVILADKATLPLTVTTDTADIHGTNILCGSNNPVSLDGDGKVPVPGTADKGFPFVLSVDANGTIGFRQYTGSGPDPAIPANKAYYVK